MLFTERLVLSALVAAATVCSSSAFTPVQLANTRQVQVSPLSLSSVETQESNDSLSSFVSSDDDDDDGGILSYELGEGLELPEADLSAEDLVINDGDLGDEVPYEESESDIPGSIRIAELMNAARLKYRRHESDTGSPEFQVAGMTERIRYLTAHLKMHPKDFSTRRGLVAVVNKRRRLLNFLADENRIRYEEVKSEMGIRHRAPSKVQTKDEQYGRYPQQKNFKKTWKSSPANKRQRK